MTHTIRLNGARTISLLGALVATLALAPAAGAQTGECTADADCGEGFECIKGMSTPGCENPPDCPSPEPVEDEVGWCERTPITCQSDADCPADYLSCVEGASSGTCTAGPGEEPVCEELPPGPSTCQFAPRECATDADCSANFTCQTFETGGDCPTIACDEGDPDCEVTCTPTTTTESYCVPQEIECASNADCPSDWACQTYSVGSCSGGGGTGGAASGGGSADPEPPPEGWASRAPAGTEPGCTEETLSVCVPPYLEELGGGSVSFDDDSAGGEATGGANGPQTPRGDESGSSSGGASDDDGCSVTGGAGAPHGGAGWLLALGALVGFGARRRRG